MKKKFNQIILLAFFALFIFTSCQDESIAINNPNDQETILPNSVLANLMLRTTSNDGALDDILDSANCLAVNLPVTIMVNNITITINTLDDLELIAQIFNEFDNDEDILEFLFPITIVLNDYSQVVINNQEEFEEFAEECTSDDNVIECVDFQYPISFSLYNTDFQVTETVVIENDEELYLFLQGLENSNDGVVLASLNFPVTLEYANGETLEVNNNQELEEAINTAEDNCDDVNDNCSEDDVAMYLKECFWRVVSFNGDDNFIQYEFHFNNNGTLEITDGFTTGAIGGNWETSLSNDGSPEVVISNLTAFSDDLGGSWIVVECDDDRFELVRETASNSTTIVIEQECESDLPCSAQQISAYLQECIWFAGTNLYNNVVADSFQFNEDGTVIITNTVTNDFVTGAWHISLTNSGVFITLDLPEPFNVISLEWKVTECDEDRIKMWNGDDYLVFERDCNFNAYDCDDLQANFGDECESNGLVGFINENCECETQNTNPFECFESFDAEIVACSDSNDGYAEFNLTVAFSNCTPGADVVTYFETLQDAQAYVNPISNPEVFTNYTNPQTIYVRVEIGDAVEIFEIQLIVEDCSNDCSEQQINTNLIECHWNIVNYNGSNDLEIYNLNFEVNSGVVVIYNDNTTIDASWSTSQNSDGVWLEFGNVNGANIQAISGNWLVVECTDDRLELSRSNDTMVIERDCN